MTTHRLHDVDGAVVDLTLAEFLDCNDADEDMCAAVSALRPGETYSDGGGAAPEWSITRLGCTEADHEALRAELAAGLAEPPAEVTSERGLRWLSRARPWPGEPLIVGECACGSTIAIEAPLCDSRPSA